MTASPRSANPGLHPTVPAIGPTSAPAVADRPAGPGDDPGLVRTDQQGTSDRPGAGQRLRERVDRGNGEDGAGRTGVPFEDKTAKLPQLIDRAQRELGLHPQTAAPGPDGSQAVKRILGGLSGIAWPRQPTQRGLGHGHAARRTGLCPRHGYLVVGAAHTWCQVILDTLADPSGPWHMHTAAATAG
ncbi:abortive infection family protein [Plantactinospora sp. WMMB782]|uniref:abortive infection family protein n=1 Tax=Plantactinospora sp. WMMB782 TaxID=3404121 RepID=UPI003B931052